MAHIEGGAKDVLLKMLHPDVAATISLVTYSNGKYFLWADDDILVKSVSSDAFNLSRMFEDHDRFVATMQQAKGMTYKDLSFLERQKREQNKLT